MFSALVGALLVAVPWFALLKAEAIGRSRTARRSELKE